MNTNRVRRGFLGSVRALTALALLTGIISFSRAASAQTNAVFTSTNTATNNSVTMYRRAGNGTLTAAASYFTGGAGTGTGLGSQGAIALSPDGGLLFVVNAGSNDISVFAVSGYGLRLLNRVSSGGERPISLTVSGRLIYVLNAGVPNNINGFRYSSNGRMVAIPGSTQGLSDINTTPAQIGFDPDGESLVVTEKGTQKIDVFPVDDQGVAGEAAVGNSVGVTPFGFSFDRPGHLFVTEAQGGATGASTVSSYYTSDYGILPISGSIPTTQTAACWLAVSKDGKTVWTANAGSSNTISSFDTSVKGKIRLREAVAGSGLQGANDLTFSEDGRFLYALENRGGSVRAFRINPNKTLTLIGSFGNFPGGITGLAAY